MKKFLLALSIGVLTLGLTLGDAQAKRQEKSETSWCAHSRASYTMMPGCQNPTQEKSRKCEEWFYRIGRLPEISRPNKTNAERMKRSNIAASSKNRFQVML